MSPYRRSLARVLAALWRTFVPASARHMPAVLTIAGLCLLSLAAGMLSVVAGVAVAGVALLLLGWLSEKD